MVAHGTGALNIDACRIAPGDGVAGHASGKWPTNALLDDREADAFAAKTGRDASRYFFVSKPDTSERVCVDGVTHPTVKPLSLMRELVRLVTPPGGVVVDPFAGSGTTVEACVLEGFSVVGVERDPVYLPLIRQRVLRRRDPVRSVVETAGDPGLFALFES